MMTLARTYNLAFTEKDGNNRDHVASLPLPTATRRTTSKNILLTERRTAAQIVHNPRTRPTDGTVAVFNACLAVDKISGMNACHNSQLFNKLFRKHKLHTSRGPLAPPPPPTPHPAPFHGNHNMQ